MEVSGFIPIPPRPASRPRFTCRGRFAVAYTDKPYAEWIAAVVPMLKAQPVPEGWDPGVPLILSMDFQVLKPKTSKLLFPKPDLDNYEKAFMDAVTKAGHLWEDDSQVVSLRTNKLFVTEGEGIAFRLTPFA